MRSNIAILERIIDDNKNKLHWLITLQSTHRL